MAKSGYLGEPQALKGTLSNPDNLRGTLSDPEGLTGTLEGLLVRGYSAYDIARALGYVGTEAEWITSLKGDPGDPGTKGDPGEDYILTEQDKQDIAGLVNVPVTDVQIDGASILSNGVANVPVLDNTLNKVGDFYAIPYFHDGYANGFSAISRNGKYYLALKSASNSGIKSSKVLNQNGYGVIDPSNIHVGTFYGLAKSAGDTTQSKSSNAVGTYTDEAKAAIRTMLGIETLSEIISAVHDSYGSAEGVSF